MKTGALSSSNSKVIENSSIASELPDMAAVGEDDSSIRTKGSVKYDDVGTFSSSYCETIEKETGSTARENESVNPSMGSSSRHSETALALELKENYSKYFGESARTDFLEKLRKANRFISFFPILFEITTPKNNRQCIYNITSGMPESIIMIRIFWTRTTLQGLCTCLKSRKEMYASFFVYTF
jgi:hypothetical protein